MTSQSVASPSLKFGSVCWGLQHVHPAIRVRLRCVLHLFLRMTSGFVVVRSGQVTSYSVKKGDMTGLERVIRTHTMHSLLRVGHRLSRILVRTNQYPTSILAISRPEWSWPSSHIVSCPYCGVFGMDWMPSVFVQSVFVPFV